MKMSMKPIRIGIIGCGTIGGRHVESYRSTETSVEVVAACDVVPEVVEGLVEDYDIPEAYTSAKSMLDQEHLDVVSVTTPQQYHVEPVVQSAERGVDAIWCEKPMATDLGGANRMLASCREHDVHLMVNHSMRFEPNWREIKRMLEDEEIGELQHIKLEYLGDQGTLLNNGTHACDGLRWFGGEPEWVVGTVDRERSTESATSFFEFDNGVTATYVSGAHTEYAFEGLTFEGTEGRIVARNHRGWQPAIQVWRKGDEMDPFRSGTDLEIEESDAFVGAAAEILSAADTGDPPVSSGADGRMALKMVLGVYESHRHGRKRVDIPTFDLEESPLDLMLANDEIPTVWARDFGEMH